MPSGKPGQKRETEKDRQRTKDREAGPPKKDQKYSDDDQKYTPKKKP